MNRNSLNQVSLDTDNLLIRRVFAFDSNNAPLPENHILSMSTNSEAKWVDTLRNIESYGVGYLPDVFSDISGRITGLSNYFGDSLVDRASELGFLETSVFNPFRDSVITDISGLREDISSNYRTLTTSINMLDNKIKQSSVTQSTLDAEISGVNLSISALSASVPSLIRFNDLSNSFNEFSNTTVGTFYNLYNNTTSCNSFNILNNEVKDICDNIISVNTYALTTRTDVFNRLSNNELVYRQFTSNYNIFSNVISSTLNQVVTDFSSEVTLTSFTDVSGKLYNTMSNVNILNGITTDLSGRVSSNTTAINSVTSTANVIYNNLYVSNIKIGTSSYVTDQRINIGYGAGASLQSGNTIAIGHSAGNISQQEYALAIGKYAGQYNQCNNAVAIGIYAGFSNQGSNAISIGYDAGKDDQDNYAIAIGHIAGKTSQRSDAIAIGWSAGYSNQQEKSIAIGHDAARDNQGANSIAIGNSAGSQGQEANSIAIGTRASQYYQHPNSIVINAAGSNVISAGASTLVIKPIRKDKNANTLMYNSSSGEITFDTIGRFSNAVLGNKWDTVTPSSMLHIYNNNSNDGLTSFFKMQNRNDTSNVTFTLIEGSLNPINGTSEIHIGGSDNSGSPAAGYRISGGGNSTVQYIQPYLTRTGGSATQIQIAPYYNDASSKGVTLDISQGKYGFNTTNLTDTVNINGTLKVTGNLTVSGTASVGSIAGTIPIGGIIMWSGTTIIAGWALCDGGIYNGIQTPDLRGRFILGATYSSGSTLYTGQSTTLPGNDTNGYTLTRTAVNTLAGEVAHVLSVAEMPSHFHTINDPGHRHGTRGWRGNDGGDDSQTVDNGSAVDYGNGNLNTANQGNMNVMYNATTGITINTQGSNAAHNNQPPYYALAFIMRCY
jgi:microcystin-dependent protein